MSSGTEVIVKVFGQRPDNILLMVHEVFESLIDEFYQGVRYEYVLPCADCIKVVRNEDLSLDSKKNVFSNVKQSFVLQNNVMIIIIVLKETKEPAMFSSKVLRRAIEMKALFLQCHTFFHTLSITEIQGNCANLHVKHTNIYVSKLLH